MTMIRRQPVLSRKPAHLVLSLSLFAAMTTPAFSEGLNDLLNHGAEAYERGNYADAARQYRKVLSQDSQHPVARMGLAKALLAEGKTEEAKAQLLQLTQEHPDFGAAYYLLGTVYEKEGNPTQAREAYQRYVQHSKGSIPPDPAIRLKLRQYGVL